MSFLTRAALKGQRPAPRVILRSLGACLLLAVLCTCGPAEPPAPSEASAAISEPSPAAKVIARALARHGTERYDSVLLSFAFRERAYHVRNVNGDYRYLRTFTDSLGGAVVDMLTNERLVRTRDGQRVALTTKDSAAYAASVNSVRYFFMLPYGLQDPAVKSDLLDSVTIAGDVYDRIRVTFAESGGGVDFEDVYHYFFSRESGEMDYLAYTFEADGGGIRFREAINRRRIDGVLVQDYVNYGLDGDDRDIETIAARYEAGQLPELSVIENTEVRISDPTVSDPERKLDPATRGEED